MPQICAGLAQWPPPLVSVSPFRSVLIPSVFSSPFRLVSRPNCTSQRVRLYFSTPACRLSIEAVVSVLSRSQKGGASLSLPSTPRTLPPRHQSLRTRLRHSFSLADIRGDACPAEPLRFADGLDQLTAFFHHLGLRQAYLHIFRISHHTPSSQEVCPLAF